ncbi:Uncharacterized protein FWK35_00001031, partial [Aphis craccivora]
MIITSRNNAPISNFVGGFRWKSEYPWCIIEVKSKHLTTFFKKNQKKKTEKQMMCVFYFFIFVSVTRVRVRKNPKKVTEK